MNDRPHRHELRETFDEVSELYERARPVYPSTLFDELAQLAGLPNGGRVLEIGPGTGQATLPLAERGLQVTGIELGEALASVARRKLQAYPNARIINAAFESWTPPGEPFDAVVAFTSFHWIDPEVRFEKAATILRDGGSLAIVTTQHVRAASGETFWVDVQADYDAFDPSDDNAPPPYHAEVGDLSGEIAASGAFENVAVRRYLWDVVYTADTYIDVLDTYSGHRLIEPQRRQRLHDAIHRRIEAQPDGEVTKTYLAVLNVARPS
jgi:SAM-dependent methyltransferase